MSKGFEWTQEKQKYHQNHQLLMVFTTHSYKYYHKRKTKILFINRVYQLVY